MPSSFLLKRAKISVKDEIFDFKKFYNFYKKIYEERGFFVDEKQFEKVPGKVNKIMFYWECSQKVDDYNQFFLHSKVVLNYENIIVLKNGIKQKLNRGNGSISFKATLKTDYDVKWEQNPLITFFKTIIENIFEKSKLEKYKGELINNMYDIENEVKSFFEIQKMM